MKKIYQWAQHCYVLWGWTDDKIVQAVVNSWHFSYDYYEAEKEETFRAWDAKIREMIKVYRADVAAVEAGEAEWENPSPKDPSGIKDYTPVPYKELYPGNGSIYDAKTKTAKY